MSYDWNDETLKKEIKSGDVARNAGEAKPVWPRTDVRREVPKLVLHIHPFDMFDMLDKDRIPQPEVTRTNLHVPLTVRNWYDGEAYTIWEEVLEVDGRFYVEDTAVRVLSEGGQRLSRELSSIDFSPEVHRKLAEKGLKLNIPYGRNR